MFQGEYFVSRVKVGFILVLAILIYLNGPSAFALAAGSSTGGKSPADTGKAAVMQVIADSAGQKADAGKQADPKKTPAQKRQIILVKIVNSGDETMDVCLDDFVLDVPGCTYEPADKGSPFVIRKNILIAADNIILADAAIEGDIYIDAKNTTLRNLDVNGTIYIDPALNKGLKLDNVAADNVSIRTSCNTGAGRDTGSSEDGTGDPGDTSMNSSDEDAEGSRNGDNDVRDSNTGNTADVAKGNAGGNGTGAQKAEAKSTSAVSSNTGSYASRGNDIERAGAGNSDAAQADNRISNAGSEAAGEVMGGSSNKSNTNNNTNKNTRAYMTVADIDNCSSYFVIVNKTRVLPSDWRPDDLVRLNVKYNGRAEARYLRKEASDALAELFAAAAKKGVELCAVSGFRSYELQQTVFNKHVNQMGFNAALRVSAMPGRSEHQTGLAIDISSKSMNYSLSKSFANTREGKWLAENAAKYGFILRYPEGKESITGYDYEPWHFRYVGKDAATDIMEKGLTLEEYFGLVDVNMEPQTAAEGKDVKA